MNETETIYYIGNNVATPADTGFATLGEYLQSKWQRGYRGIYGPISDFEELPLKQWGYGVFAYVGEGGYVWDVEIFRALTSEKYYRQLNVASGGWILPDWTPYATATRPQELDLPLAAGITATLPSIYRRNQFGELTYTLFVDIFAGIADGAAIATLPAGYRPPTGRGSLFECGAITGSTRYGGNTITVRPDGVMVYNGAALPSGSKLWSHGSFLVQ